MGRDGVGQGGGLGMSSVATKHCITHLTESAIFLSIFLYVLTPQGDIRPLRL